MATARIVTSRTASGPTENIINSNSEGTLLGSFLLYIYLLLVIIKKIVGFDDGVMDVIILSLIFIFLSLSPLKTIRGLTQNKIRSKTVFAIILFTCFYVILAFKYNSNVKLTFIEYLSTFKWLIYYLLGLLLGVTSSRLGRSLFCERHLFVISSVIFAYSLINYNWFGLFSYGISFKSFYDNSFESLFSLRSVFALFGLVVLLYCVNNFRSALSVIMLFYALTFLYMAGNRKMLIALAVILFVFPLTQKYRLLMNTVKIIIILFLIAYIPTTDLYKNTQIEYTNLDQPRIFTYLKAIEIASDYFPIGSGPSTFASRGSMIDYSPIYSWYGLSNKYGFRSDDEEHFYNDTYWCQIIGQYGVFGTLLVFYILLSMYWELKKYNGGNVKFRYEFVLALLVLLSTTTPLFQRTEIGLFIFLTFGYSIGGALKLRSLIS